MGCGSSAPQVNDNTNIIQDKRKKGEKHENVKIDVSEDPEMQGEKFHMNESGEQGEDSGGDNGGEKDSFDDF